MNKINVLIILSIIFAITLCNPCYYIYPVQNINKNDTTIYLTCENCNKFSCIDFTYRVNFLESGKTVYSTGDNYFFNTKEQVLISTTCFKYMPYPFESQLYPCSLDKSINIWLLEKDKNNTLLQPNEIAKYEDIRNILLGLTIWIPAGSIVACVFILLCIGFFCCVRRIKQNYTCC